MTPKLRFKGFDDAWEQRKFSDVVEIGSGKDYKNLGLGDIPVYGTGGYMLSVDQSLSKDRDAIGIGRKGTIDKPFIIRAPFWTVDTLFYCIPKNKQNLQFTYCLFQNVDWKTYDESTGVPSLSKSTINNVTTKLPNLEEQQKIGELFNKLDTTITLHQRQCEVLKKQKQFFLQNMFPKEGESEPRIRFNGFTEPWEQRELREFVDKAVDNRGKTPSLNKDGNHPLIEVASLGNCRPDYSKVSKYLDDNAFYNELRSHVKEDDILFSTVGNVGLVSLMDKRLDACIAQNIVAFRAKNYIDAKFLFALFSN